MARGDRFGCGGLMFHRMSWLAGAQHRGVARPSSQPRVVHNLV